MTETHPHMGSHSGSGSEGTAMYSLAIAILLGLVILSASVYFGLGAVANTMFEKDFYSKTPIVVNQAAAQAGAQQPAQQQAQQQQEPEPQAPAVQNVKIEGRPIKGAKDAQVTIVEFSEYLCPYCRKAQPTMDKILTDYAGKVRIIPYSFLVHEQARKMQEAGECALEQGEENFFKMDSKLYTVSAYEPADLKKYAKEVGLDSAKFDACLDSGTKSDAVDAQSAYGRSLGVGGTPSFFINGKLIVGAYPYENFKQMIDAELAS